MSESQKEKEKKKKKKQQSILEKEIMSIMSKSMRHGRQPREPKPRQV